MTYKQHYIWLVGSTCVRENMYVPSSGLGVGVVGEVGGAGVALGIVTSAGLNQMSDVT